MLQTDQPMVIQGLILDPTTSDVLQDESCAPTHAGKSAAFMLQNDQPMVIQGLILDPITSDGLQDESCAPTHVIMRRSGALHDASTV
jgi:uncharacterized membrane protein